MTKHITVATTLLDDPAKAASEIDRVLTTMMIESRPVYIGVPTDLSHFPISGKALQDPLNVTLPADDEKLTKTTVEEIRSLIEKAPSAILIIDGCRC